MSIFLLVWENYDKTPGKFRPIFKRYLDKGIAYLVIVGYSPGGARESPENIPHLKVL